MEKFREFSRENRNIFFEAIKTGDLETVLMFLEAGINPNAKNFCETTPLNMAVCHSELEIIRLLLLSGADPNIGNLWNKTPLFYLKSDNSVIVELLLAAGANPNVTNVWEEIPLHSYIYHNYLRVAEMVLLAGANANYKNKSRNTLLIAKEYGCVKMIQLLLDHGAK